MTRHCGPVNIWVHRFAIFDGITGKQQKTTEGFDLVELLFSIITADFDAVFLNEKRNQVSAIATVIPLNSAYFVKEGRQNTCVGVSHTGKGVGFVLCYVFFDLGLAVILCPFMKTILGVVDVPIKEFSVIGVKHNLSDCGAGAFWNDAVHNAFGLCHPSTWKTHTVTFLFVSLLFYVSTMES